MKISQLAPLALAAALAGCGEKPPPPPPDAGVDTSCGLDCANQQRFGLIVDRCFEYSRAMTAEQFPSVGARVRPVKELEGGLQVIPVDYLQSGLIAMTDHFFFKDGDLMLARRTWPSSGDSVNYKDADGNIVGVTWFEHDTVEDRFISTEVTADVIDAPNRAADPTTYGVTTLASTSTERIVPLATFETALKLVFDEDPPHGFDGKRVFVENTGFILFTSSLSLATSGGQEYRLQAIRDIGSADGGTHECGAIP